MKKYLFPTIIAAATCVSAAFAVASIGGASESAHESSPAMVQVAGATDSLQARELGKLLDIAAEQGIEAVAIEDLLRVADL